MWALEWIGYSFATPTTHGTTKNSHKSVAKVWDLYTTSFTLLSSIADGKQTEMEAQHLKVD